MTIENSEDTAHLGVTDPAEPVAERASALAESEDVEFPIDDAPPEASSPAVIEALPTPAMSDSMPPISRKLAPPPKPRRDSSAVSHPPSGQPPNEMAIVDALTASALKAPTAPNISLAGDAVFPMASRDSEPDTLVKSTSPSTPPLGSPSPIPKLGSNPAIAAVEAAEVVNTTSTRAPSDPALGSSPPSPPSPLAAPPRPASVAPPPRPRSEPPPAAPPVVSASGMEAAPASSAAPSSSAIFAMRIIAVGDAARAKPAAAEPGDAYPPSASRLGTGTRRSSRPSAPALVVPNLSGVPGRSPVPDLPPVPSASADLASVAALAEAAPASADAAPASADAAPASADAAPASADATTAAPQIDPVKSEVAHELSDDDVSPDSVEKKIAVADAEELGREDAISVLPEEVPAFQAEAKTDPGKPPPPPKRPAGLPPSAPLLEPATISRATQPPTPDPAAAKAAQRAKTRQPWWEDLFNEDFMRATSKVSDEQIRREVTFIEDSLGVAAGGVVLDLGCGGGHHAVEFASRGYGVVGYDLSLYQLALAADVAQERSQKINFLQGDMREMAFEEMFDGVFCWNTTFGYFEEDKNLAVAQRVFKALRPGGMFLIDVLNRDFAAASSPCTVWYEGDSCVCMDDMSVDYISSRLRVKRSIILDDGRTKESLFSLRLYSLHELGKLLHDVGFRVTEASGHLATPGVFFGPNSPRIIMLAQRP
ncbi:MAG: methyltransferase domain-containing protein [Polyangiaceae bacterium]